MAVYSNQASVLWLEESPTTPSIVGTVMQLRFVRLSNPRSVATEMDRVTVLASSGAKVTLPFTKNFQDILNWNQIWERGEYLEDGLNSKTPHFWQPPADTTFSIVLTDAQGGQFFAPPMPLLLRPAPHLTHPAISM